MAFKQAIAPLYAVNFGSTQHVGHRGFVWDANREPIMPTAAARIDGVATKDGLLGIPAIKGLPVQMTAGAAISAAAALEVTGTVGKVVTQSAGVTVGRALEAASADGDVIWCVFE